MIGHCCPLDTEGCSKQKKRRERYDDSDDESFSEDIVSKSVDSLPHPSAIDNVGMSQQLRSMRIRCRLSKVHFCCDHLSF